MAKVENQIRWRHGDYVTLGKAVAKFNRKINELQTEENKLYLPEIQEYSNLKQDITTRKELNRIVKMLKSFNSDNASLYETESGEKITEWEYQQIKSNIRTAKRRLNQELAGIDKKSQPYTSQEETQIREQLNNLNKFEKLTGYEFNRFKRRVRSMGSLDYNMRKAIVYRENYMKAIESLSSYENYPAFKKQLDSIRNPMEFYNFIQQSDIMSDLFLWYDNNAGLTYGAFVTNEDAFNYALAEDFNI